MISYTLLAGIILYFVILKMVDSGKLGAGPGAGVVVLGNFVISLIPMMIASGGVSGLFGGREMAVLAAQFVVALVIFKQIERSDESITAWLVYGWAGVVLVFWAVPGLVQNLM